MTRTHVSNFPGRDIACFVFALALHSLLLLWKGGVFNMTPAGEGLGDMLVQVDFLSEAPDFSQPAGPAQGGGSGFFARMKSIMHRTPVARPSAKAAADFFAAQKKGADGLKETENLALGETKNIDVKPSIGTSKKAASNLKQKSFQVSAKDMPFEIATHSNARSNDNEIAVDVGEKTSIEVRSLAGGPGSGPALRTKKSSGRGLVSGAASFGGAQTADALSGAALSGSAGSSDVISNVPSLGGSGQGSGSGDSAGSGQGRAHGGGYGGSGGQGRSWGGGMAAESVRALPRHTVDAAEPAGMKAARNSGFNITGALAHRGIRQKHLPGYEMDARVTLHFAVDWSGRVMDGIVVEISSGSPSFDQKVMDSLKRWMFVPLPEERANEVQEGNITFIFRGV